MKRFLVIIILLFLTHCSKNGDNSGLSEYFFKGTVYLRNIPAADVLVNMGHRDTMMQQGDWYADKMTRTDENGNYAFKMTTANALGFQWRARAQHPETNFWTEWKQGRAVSPGLSGTGIIDIYLK